MNRMAHARLRKACDRAKYKLLSRSKETILLYALVDGEDFEYTLTHDEFTAMNGANFQRCLCLVEKALTDANIGKEKVQEVMFIGRPTRMVELRDMMRRFFS
ncbi:unnamed protein product [Ectocarpus fasciculatus]